MAELIDFSKLIPEKTAEEPGAQKDSGLIDFNKFIPQEPVVSSKKSLIDFSKFIPSELPLYKTHESTESIPYSGMTPEERVEKYGKIEQWTKGEEFVDRMKRFSNVSAKAVAGDIPFVRNLLTESIKGAEPQTKGEKIVSPLLTMGRDVYGYSKAGKLIKPFTDVQRVTKTGRFIAKGVSESFKGGLLGAATAGSEDPIEIAKKAGTYAAITAGTIPAIEITSWAGSRVADALGKSKNLGNLSEWLGLKLRENKANELVRKRHGEIESRLIDSERFVSDLSRQITPEQDKALSFLVEAGNLGSLKGGTKKAAVSIRKYLDKAHSELMADYGKDVGFIKDYVPHMWDIPKNKEKAVIDWFITRNPHLKKRRIDTIQEGIKKFGLKPKYEKITDVLRTYDQVRIKSAANLKFVDDLKALQDENGVKLIQRKDKAPASWKEIDHPAVRRSMGHYIGKGEEKKLVLSKEPIKVHPSIYPDVKAVLDTYKPGNAIRTLDTINTSVKQSVLTLSLFHHSALTETAIAAGTGKEALKMWNPVKIYKAFKSGKHKSFLNNVPLAKEGVKDGLTLGSISDVEGGRSLVEALKVAEKHTGENALSLGIKTGIRKPLEFNNKVLWDYLHTSFKLNAYSKLKTDMLKMYPDKPVKTVGKEAAQFVNDTFGGQPWEIMAKTKQWQQFSRFLLLSPDWVLSTMKQALSPFGVGATSKAGKEIRKEMGKDFWRKAIVYFGGSMNMLNYAYTKAHTGKGRYMWDNDPGKETYLFIGYNDDGTERYLRWGKQFRELAEAINDPPKVAARKISPLIRITKNQLFPDALYQKDIIENPFWSLKGSRGDPLPHMVARAKTLAKDVTPYSITQQQRVGNFNPLSFAVPVSRGMTPYRARKLFRTAILTKNKKLLEKVYESSLNNKIDPDPILKQAQSSIKAEQTFRDKIEARKIEAKYNKLDSRAAEIYLKKLKISGKLTPGIAKQLGKILVNKQKVQKKQTAFKELRGE